MWKSILFVLIGIGILIGFGVFAVAVIYAEEGSTFLPEYGWTIESFDAVYELQPGDEIEVTETIIVDFGFDRHGIFRDRIRRENCDERPADSFDRFPCEPGNFRIYEFDDIRVEDGEGRRVQVETESTSGGGHDFVRWRIGDPDVYVDGEQTYVLTYTLRGAANALSDRNELYWNATGTWTVPVEVASVRVVFPGQVSESSGECYEGPAGFSDECSVRANGTTLLFETTEMLDYREQLTLAAIWPEDELQPPAPMYEDIKTFSDIIGGSFLEFILAGLLVLGVVPTVYWAWWSHGRDRRYTTIHYLTNDTTEETMPLFADDDNIVVEFLPPEDLRPGQMGVIINEGPTTRDVSATIVDLAVRGYIHIEETGEGRKRDWTFTRLKKPDAELLPYEKALMNHLFAYGREEIQVSKLKDKFASKLSDVKNKMMADAMSRHWFPRKPSVLQALWLVLGFITVAGGGAMFVGLGYFFGHGLIGVPVALGGLGLLAIAPHMSRRTAVGSEVHRRVSGFELYVATAETRMQDFNEQQNIFARYLPYAMTFECVDKWAKAFKGLENNPQAAGVSSWYAGGAATGFSASHFSSSMNSFTSSVGATFASTPSSSGGGGGGGSSGGGGGGGGGGSW